MTKRKLKPWVRWFLLLLAAAIITASFFVFKNRIPVFIKTDHPADHSGSQALTNAVHEDPDAFKPNWTRADFEEKYAVNNEYIFQIRFESGLIDQPVCDANNNSKYLYTNFETQEYDPFGTVFLEEEADIDSMNMTLYGHYSYPEVDPEQVTIFTPLHVLTDQANYEANKYIDILTENDARRFQIAEVFYCQLNYSYDTQAYDWVEDALSYYRPQFDPVFFENYKARIKELEFYDTGVDFSCDDHLLTLQTCVPNRDDLRLIIIAKETERIPLE